jgi:hypothetical protein
MRPKELRMIQTTIFILSGANRKLKKQAQEKKKEEGDGFEERKDNGAACRGV